MLSLPLLKKTAVLTQELLSLTPRRVYFQPPVTSIKRLGAKWLTRESLDAAYICIVGFHSSLLFLLDLKLQVPFNDKP